MKKTALILSCILFVMLFTQGQEIVRLAINTSSKTGQPSLDALKKKKEHITQYNALVDSFKLKKNGKNFQNIRSYVEANMAADTNMNKMHPVINNFDMNTDADALKLAEDTTTIPIDTKSTDAAKAAATCSAIGALKELKVEKNNDAEYVCTLTDTANNPVKSFVMKQFNEKLFNDKLKSSIYSICNGIAMSKDDSDAIEKFYSGTISQQNLYQRMLEASLEVKDEKVLAGILKIFKRIPVIISIDTVVTTAPPANTDTPGDGKLPKTGSIKNKREDMLAGSSKGFDRKAIFVNAADDAIYPVTDGLTATGINVEQDHNSKPSPLHKKANEKYGSLVVHDVNIQFQDGFMENIIVLGNLEGSTKELKFENAYPISFSTRKDFRRLQDIDIFERTVYARDRDTDSSCRIRLGDLFSYNQNLQLNTKDYSPVNDVLQQKITEDITSVNLYKELTSKILEMKVFSDLKGIDNNEPNGLIQFELTKKLNFLSMRFPVPSKRSKLNLGLFNYFTPTFIMNKIEDNNKRLVPSYIGTKFPDTLKANVFSSSLELFQHQVFTVGGNLTILTVDIPGLKSTINFNLCNYWGRVLMEDTVRNKIDSSRFTAIKDNNIHQFGVNSIQFSPEVSWQVFPDRRYGIIFTQKFTKYKLENSLIRQVKDSTDYTSYIKSLKGDRTRIENYDFKKWLATSEIYAFFAPTEYNKVFFRYRFNWDMKNIKNNFHQIQIGISTFLTHTMKSDKQKDR
jgi:hypothetical protein